MPFAAPVVVSFVTLLIGGAISDVVGGTCHAVGGTPAPRAADAADDTLGVGVGTEALPSVPSSASVASSSSPAPIETPPLPVASAGSSPDGCVSASPPLAMS